MNTNETNANYGYYSKLLKEPFDTIEELVEAEEAYYAKLKAKEDKAAEKRADAQKVEDAFKALNAARKEYKEKLSQLTEEYSEALTELKTAFEVGKEDIHNTLAAAEESYSSALKEFTEKYESGYHLTLKDGDFETTISGNKAVHNKKKTGDSLANLFEALFGF